MSLMGFTITSNTESKQELKKTRTADQSTGYLEVSSPASYSLTAGS
jgi:hypothetical protein